MSRINSVAVKFTFCLFAIAFLTHITIKVCQSTTKSIPTTRVPVESTTESILFTKLSVELTTESTTKFPDLLQHCGQQQNPGGLISNGNASQSTQFPWAGVMLWKDTMQPFCGCSLISDGFAITASHCFYEKNADAITSMSKVLVQFGRNDLSDDQEEGFVTRSIIDLTLHEDWDPRYGADRYDADIAIIRFNQTVRFSTRIQPICLPIADENILKNGTVVS